MWVAAEERHSLSDPNICLAYVRNRFYEALVALNDKEEGWVSDELPPSLESAKADLAWMVREVEENPVFGLWALEDPQGFSLLAMDLDNARHCVGIKTEWRF